MCASCRKECEQKRYCDNANTIAIQMNNNEEKCKNALYHKNILIYKYILVSILINTIHQDYITAQNARFALRPFFQMVCMW